MFLQATLNILCLYEAFQFYISLFAHRILCQCTLNPWKSGQLTEKNTLPPPPKYNEL